MNAPSRAGVILLFLAFCFSGSLEAIFNAFPRAILGVILFLTGAQLALGSCDFGKTKEDRFVSLVTAACAVSSLPADHDDGGNDLTINGKSVPNYLGWTLTYPFNLMAWCPAMSVPSGFGATGMPTAVQIVGRTFDDPTVFRIAAALEQARPWRGRQPAL